MQIIAVVLFISIGILVLVSGALISIRLKQEAEPLRPLKPFGLIRGRGVSGPPRSLSYHEKLAAELRERQRLARQLRKSQAARKKRYQSPKLDV